MLLKAAAVRDDDGEIEAAVTIIEDVTAAKRAALRMEFLARAGERARLLAGLPADAAQRRRPRGAADRRLVRRRPVRRGGRARTGGDRAHPTRASWRRPRACAPTSPSSSTPSRASGCVRRTGESAALHRDPRRAARRGGASTRSTCALLREVGMRAVLIVPLTVRGRTIGALTMVERRIRAQLRPAATSSSPSRSPRGRRSPSRTRACTASARRSRARCRDSLLPEAIPEIPGWEVAALYRPAGQESEVGGDFYDFWEVDGDWLMMIGDVTGKGVGAAAVTSLVRHTARAASEFDPRPAQVLARIDAALRRRPAVSLCTALCLRISRRRRDARRRWAPAAAARGRAAAYAEVGEHGTLLGALARTRWPEDERRAARPARRSSRSPTASRTRWARAASAGASSDCGRRWPTRADVAPAELGARLVADAGRISGGRAG